MLGNSPFGFNLIRKYVVSFGNLFSNIQIVRQGATKSGNFFPKSTDDEGVNVEMLKVPLVFSSKNKLLARVDGDPKIERKDAITLPRIAFEMSGMTYDPSRKIGSIRSFSWPKGDQTDTRKHQLSPVPYNFSFVVYIATEYQEEGNQIIEQILPFFTPMFPMRLSLIPEMGQDIDTPVFLKSVVKEDNYRGEYQDRRTILWTLEFTVPGYLFGPIRKMPCIKFIDVGFQNVTVSNTSPIIANVTIQPGLTANGLPTTDPLQSVDYHLIDVNDDWGYATAIHELYDSGQNAQIGVGDNI